MTRDPALADDGPVTDTARSAFSPATVIDSRCVTDFAGQAESVARTVNAYVPAAHGSSRSAPSLLSVIPAGSFPDASVQV